MAPTAATLSRKTRQQHRQMIAAKIAEHRAARGNIDLRDLMRRADDAARLEMAGHDADRRQECAATIVEQTLRAVSGDAEQDSQLWTLAAPRADDPLVSLTALKNKARTYRRSIEHRAQMHVLEDHRDGAAASAPDTALGVRIDRDSIPTCWRAADLMRDRLRIDSDAAWLVLYSAARQRSIVGVAAELGRNYDAAAKSHKRGERAIRAAYPDPRELVRVLVGRPVGEAATWAALDDEPLTYATDAGPWPTEARREQDTARTHALARPDREGTDGGERPERPTDKDDADRRCSVRKDRYPNGRIRRLSAKQISDAQRAASLRRLGQAYAADARRPRNYRTPAQHAPKIARAGE